MELFSSIIIDICLSWVMLFWGQLEFFLVEEDAIHYILFNLNLIILKYSFPFDCFFFLLILRSKKLILYIVGNFYWYIYLIGNVLLDVVWKRLDDWVNEITLIIWNSIVYFHLNETNLRIQRDIHFYEWYSETIGTIVCYLYPIGRF